MHLTLISKSSYKSQYMPHVIEVFGKTITVIHKLNNKQRAECTLDVNCILTLETLDEDGATIYFENEFDFGKVVTMLNQFLGTDEW